MENFKSLVKTNSVAEKRTASYTKCSPRFFYLSYSTSKNSTDYRLLFLRPEFAIWWQNNPKLLVYLRSLYGQEIGNRRFADSSLDEVFVVTRTTLDQVLSTI